MYRLYFKVSIIYGWKKEYTVYSMFRKDIFKIKFLAPFKYYSCHVHTYVGCKGLISVAWLFVDYYSYFLADSVKNLVAAV